MLPLDVGNRHACAEHVALSACNFTLPMKELWYSVYMAMILLIVVVIPGTMFYYEADSDRCGRKLVYLLTSSPCDNSENPVMPCDGLGFSNASLRAPWQYNWQCAPYWQTGHLIFGQIIYTIRL